MQKKTRKIIQSHCSNYTVAQNARIKQWDNLTPRLDHCKAIIRSVLIKVKDTMPLRRSVSAALVDLGFVREPLTDKERERQ